MSGAILSKIAKRVTGWSACIAQCQFSPSHHTHTRPLVLELAGEEVASREEEEHPIFQRYCRRLSWGLLVLNVLQCACFFAAAFFLGKDTRGK